MSDDGSSRRRLSKSGDLKRIHTHMHPAWAREIDKAARAKGVSRSHFIATSSYEAAQAIVAKMKRAVATT